MSDILTSEQIAMIGFEAPYVRPDDADAAIQRLVETSLALHAQLAVLAQEKEATCTWTGDDDGLWTTECGHAYSFVWDGPEDNGQKFCGYCGKRLIQVAYVEPVEPNEDTGATP